MILDSSIWKNRSVFLTGHTGFKGGWLTLWLNQLGANVHGYALDPPTTPNLFEAARIKSSLVSDTRADLADMNTLKKAYDSAKPEVVFHLAAQSLVRESYKDPIGTFVTNIIGTANVLEAARKCESVKAIVIVTTDKVYENHETGRPYCEDDPLGGYDPYSASKAATEIVVASYNKSFFQNISENSVHIATARSGNVIGGGDWSIDRLVPDCLRAFANKSPVELRYPKAVRPWQHVLEPLSGYLSLAEHLLTSEGGQFAKAWNFAPDISNDANVDEVAKMVARCWGNDANLKYSESDENPHETGVLRLDSSQAKSHLNWKPKWSLHKAVQSTVNWHRDWLIGADMESSSLIQIADYWESNIN